MQGDIIQHVIIKPKRDLSSLLILMLIPVAVVQIWAASLNFYDHTVRPMLEDTGLIYPEILEGNPSKPTEGLQERAKAHNDK